MLKEDQPSTWVTHMRAKDVDQAAAQVKELGGKVVVEPCDTPEMPNLPVGRLTMITDPQGATIGIFNVERIGGEDKSAEARCACVGSCTCAGSTTAKIASSSKLPKEEEKSACDSGGACHKTTANCVNGAKKSAAGAECGCSGACNCAAATACTAETASNRKVSGKDKSEQESEDATPVKRHKK